MNRLFLTLIFISGLFHSAFSQVDARLLQYPDVSASHITFIYAGDIWVVPKEGGTANKLSSPEGSEMFPRFSPDGKSITFSGNYDGNQDVYVISAMGGLPTRLTYHDFPDRVLDWHPDGNRVLFASSRESGKQRFNQFFLLPVSGGLAQKLPLEYGEFATYSPDGNKMVFTERTRLFRTWKRYRGGMAADLVLYDLVNHTAEVLTNSDANDELPMWHNNQIYFLSDRGPEARFNLWVYDLNTKSVKQLTDFRDFDIHFPSIGPEDIVFEAGGILYLYNLGNGQYKEVKVNVVTDQMTLMPKTESVATYLSSGWISPDGKRAVLEARGDLFSMPAEDGYVKNLTRTSGIAERFPSWSPDAKSIAYWSDRSGEYELTILNLESGVEKKLTSYGPGFRYRLYWSPDSKKIAFVDQTMAIRIYDIAGNRTIDVDKDLWLTEGPLQNFSVSWTADSRWMAYSRGLDHRNNALFLFDTKNGIKQQVTSGFYSDLNPFFDPEGKYLYFVTNRNFQPVYSDLDNSFIYPNATHLAAITLRKDVKSPLEPENDDITLKEESEKDKEPETSKDKKSKKEEEKSGENQKEEIKAVEIDLAGFEERLVILPATPGNMGNVQAVKGKILYHRLPNTGSADKSKPIMIYDLEKREEKTLIADADNYLIAAKGEKVLVVKGNNLAIVEVSPDQKMEKTLRLAEMEMTIHPKEEWKQIFTDAWRLERDFFYDKNMHGVDWNAVRDRYGKLLEDVVTRWDLNYVIGEMIGELNASHTYRGGGDTEKSRNRNVGYLGADWEISDGFYRIRKIIKTAPWDSEVRSPLAEPGVEIKEGSYILAVNGMPVSVKNEPYAAFQGLAGKTVEITYHTTPSLTGAKKAIIKTLDSEERLRNLAWIENMRKRVEVATGGKVGYIFVPSTGMDGQNELVRQFMGQWTKDGLIIDERFNNGGQIPDRFIELLNRKPLAYWAVRDGKDWQWPPVAHFGPKVMMINGWSGSGGDAFPDYFRKAGLGPLVGTRTWGGLIGISGAPSLIDGGFLTVPTFRMYDPDGAWFKEGYGVDPDVEIREDPAQLAKGTDVQLEKAIEVIVKELENNPYRKPDHPAYEKR